MDGALPLHVTKPDPALFTGMFPPKAEPQFLPPPYPGTAAAAPPILIPDHIYRAALDPRVPLTIAAVYAVTAKLLNIYNTSNGKKPWAISKTKLFYAFVVVHNIFLAVYSGWTFYGMVGVMYRSVVNPSSPQGVNGFVDSMTGLHGPGGLGNAVYYNPDESRWATYSNNVTLASDGTPSRTDMGRIWNEGLAFYGWIFYLSKFYEVLDTFIILAKGKLSSTLQTYHHAGAMMCMWAGMRYMSPPIWMFVFVNSGIHTMMYTYYTLSVFNIKVPQIIKRTLTSMQITQFLVGASYAMIHSFVSYTVPVATKAVKTATAAATSIAGDSAPAVSADSPAFLDSLRQLVLGVASKVTNAAATKVITGETSTGEADSTLQFATSEETVYEYRVVPCIQTTGQTFAIWLNVFYLAPLTYLFVKFFITSYLRRAGAASSRKGKNHTESQVTVAEKAGWEAARNLEAEVYGTPAIDNGAADGKPVKGSPNGKAMNGTPNGTSNGTLNGKATKQRRYA